MCLQSSEIICNSGKRVFSDMCSTGAKIMIRDIEHSSSKLTYPAHSYMSTCLISYTRLDSVAAYCIGKVGSRGLV